MQKLCWRGLLQVVSISPISFYLINRKEVSYYTSKVGKDIIIYISYSIIIDSLDSVIIEGMLVNIGAGKEGRQIDAPVK